MFHRFNLFEMFTILNYIILGIILSITDYTKVMADNYCEDGWKFSNQSKHCYKLSDEKTNWDQARTNCQWENAYLASILDREENTFVANMLINKKVKEAWIGLFKEGLNESSYSLGLEERKSGWIWVDGEKYTPNTSLWIVNATTPEPSGHIPERSTRITDFARWGDKYFSENLNYICKKVNKQNRRCQTRWRFFAGTGYCYMLSSRSDQLEWEQANTTCHVHGGHLASVTNDIENIYLARILKSANITDAWIGLHKPGLTSNSKDESLDEKRKHWKWTDGKQYEYHCWKEESKGPYPQSAEPSAYKPEGCARITKSGSWGDQGCSLEMHYWCKAVPETRSITPPISGETFKDIEGDNFTDVMVPEIDTFLYLGVGGAAVALLILLTVVFLTLRRYSSRKTVPRSQPKTSEETEIDVEQNVVICQNPGDGSIYNMYETVPEHSVYQNHLVNVNGEAGGNINKNLYGEVKKPRKEGEDKQTEDVLEDEYEVTMVDNVLYSET